MTEKATINLKIDKELKKKLQYIGIEEEITLTEIITGFLQYGVREYNYKGKLLK